MLGKHVDFAALAADIDRWAPQPNCAKGVQSPCPAELMMRLLVQQLFNLSDEQMEFHSAPLPFSPAAVPLMQLTNWCCRQAWLW